MLNALTVRERRLLLGILAILLLGAMVKWWRWRAQRTELLDPAVESQVSRISDDGRRSLKTAGTPVWVHGEFPVLAA